MMRTTDAALTERLADSRGNTIVFVSHCLLDDNVRCLGGAFHSGAAPEMAQLIPNGVGICQMPGPEPRAWGGVRKPTMLRAYGLRDTHLYGFRRPLFRLLLWHTRLRYRILARQMAREIEQYHDAGLHITGVVGIGVSPSCGVKTTLGIRRSFETIASRPLAPIDRELVRRLANKWGFVVLGYALSYCCNAAGREPARRAREARSVTDCQAS